MSAELYRWSVALHVVSAVLWVGGMWFIGLVLAPELRTLDPELRTTLYHRVGIRTRALGWAAIGLLVVTGAYNLAYRGVDWARFASAEFWGTRLGVVLGVKLTAVVGILVLSVLHDFVWGPKLRSLEAGGPRWRTMRSRVAWIGRVNALLALVVVILGTHLFR